MGIINNRSEFSHSTFVPDPMLGTSSKNSDKVDIINNADIFLHPRFATNETLLVTDWGPVRICNHVEIMSTDHTNNLGVSDPFKGGSVPSDKITWDANLYEYDPPKTIGSIADGTTSGVLGQVTFGNANQNENIIGG